MLGLGDSEVKEKVSALEGGQTNNCGPMGEGVDHETQEGREIWRSFLEEVLGAEASMHLWGKVAGGDLQGSGESLFKGSAHRMSHVPRKARCSGVGVPLVETQVRAPGKGLCYEEGRWSPGNSQLGVGSPRPSPPSAFSPTAPAEAGRRKWLWLCTPSSQLLAPLCPCLGLSLAAH